MKKYANRCRLIEPDRNVVWVGEVVPNSQCRGNPMDLLMDAGTLQLLTCLAGEAH
jgi:hypothetical protein